MTDNIAMEKLMWEYGIAAILGKVKHGEMPPCNYKRGRKCALNESICKWESCPYSPKTKIVVKMIDDGALVQYCMRPGGSISYTRVSDGWDKTEKQRVVEISRFQPLKAAEYVCECNRCGCLITMDELMASQGQCPKCWDELNADINRQQSKKREKQ